MSWQERLNTEFTITTGDGKTFYPHWKVAEKNIEFNSTKYDFINVAGSLVVRKEPQGANYPLVFYFLGENCIDVANEFEESARDKRIWTIEHPFYGVIEGQPLNLKRVDTNYNVTAINVDFWESNDGEFPRGTDNFIKDVVSEKSTAVNESSNTAFLNGEDLQPSDPPKIKQLLRNVNAAFQRISDKKNDLQSIINGGIKAVDNILVNTEDGIIAVQDVILFPFRMTGTINDKIEAYTEVLTYLSESLNPFDRNSKLFYESQCANVFSSMCLSSVNQLDGDYTTRADIEAVTRRINEQYSIYLDKMDENQLDIYNNESSWTPDYQLQQDLSQLINYTTNKLFVLAFSARQERTVVTDSDTNLIILTHKYLGLDATDENIERFRVINNIYGRELLLIKKGRVIKYFVR